MQRNGFIDVLKFLFSIVIVIFHYYSPKYSYLGMGYTAVEFFMITSGIFFWNKYQQRRQLPSEYTKIYLKRRFKRFFPQTFLAF